MDQSILMPPLSYFLSQPVLHNWSTNCLWDGVYKQSLALSNLNEVAMGFPFIILVVPNNMFNTILSPKTNIIIINK